MQYHAITLTEHFTFFFFFFISHSYFPCQEQAEINLSKLLNLRGKHNPQLDRRKQVTAAGVCTLGDYTRHICILLLKYVFTSADRCGACCSFTPRDSLSLRQKTACRVRFAPASAAGALPGLGKGSSVTFGLHSISAAGKYYFRFEKSSLFVIYYTELSLAGLDSVHTLK